MAHLALGATRCRWCLSFKPLLSNVADCPPILCPIDAIHVAGIRRKQRVVAAIVHPNTAAGRTERSVGYRIGSKPKESPAGCSSFVNQRECNSCTPVVLNLYVVA